MKSIRARCSRKELARKPAERRLAPDVLLVGADHVAFHAPGADEPVEAPQRGVRLRGTLGLRHDTSSSAGSLDPACDTGPGRVRRQLAKEESPGISRSP